MSDQAVILPNDSPMRGSFWQKDSLITHILFDTHILFELQPIIIFSPVANFGDQSPKDVNFLSSSWSNFYFKQIIPSSLILVPTSDEFEPSHS